MPESMQWCMLVAEHAWYACCTMLITVFLEFNTGHVYMSYFSKYVLTKNTYIQTKGHSDQNAVCCVSVMGRGKAGRVQGNLMGVMCVLKGTPTTYNKDFQVR